MHHNGLNVKGHATLWIIGTLPRWSTVKPVWVSSYRKTNENWSFKRCNIMTLIFMPRVEGMAMRRN